MKKLDFSNHNTNNWENLLEFYQVVCEKSGAILKVCKPITSYMSNEFVWPSFSLFQESRHSAEEIIRDCNTLILSNAISPFVLIHPELSNDSDILEAFATYGIRQVGLWPLMFYDQSRSLPCIQVDDDFLVRIVLNDDELKDWQIVAQKVLFKGDLIPATVFRGKEFIILLGIENSQPVSTALIYLGTRSASVHMVSVLPEFRRKGYGQTTFIKAIELCRKAGYETVYAQASQMGQKPWVEIGFEISGQVDVLWKLGHSID